VSLSEGGTAPDPISTLSADEQARLLDKVKPGEKTGQQVAERTKIVSG